MTGPQGHFATGHVAADHFAQAHLERIVNGEARLAVIEADNVEAQRVDGYRARG